MINTSTSAKVIEEIPVSNERAVADECNQAKLLIDPVKAESFHLDLEDLSISQIDISGMSSWNDIQPEDSSLFEEEVFNENEEFPTFEENEISPHIRRAIQTMENLGNRLRSYMDQSKIQLVEIENKDRKIENLEDEVVELKNSISKLEEEKKIYIQQLQKKEETNEVNFKLSEVEILLGEFERQNSELLLRNRVKIRKAESKNGIYKISCNESVYKVTLTVVESRIVVLTRSSRYVELKDFVAFVIQKSGKEN